MSHRSALARRTYTLHGSLQTLAWQDYQKFVPRHRVIVATPLALSSRVVNIPQKHPFDRVALCARMQAIHGVQIKCVIELRLTTVVGLSFNKV